MLHQENQSQFHSKRRLKDHMIARAASFAVCLLALSPAQRALAETDFDGELICNTSAQIDQPGISELTVPSTEMKLSCEFQSSATGEVARYVGSLTIAKASAPMRTMIWRVSAPRSNQNFTASLAQPFDMLTRERNEPLIAVGQKQPKVRLQRMTDNKRDNEVIVIEMQLELLSSST
jgi:hypothetical protein